MARWIVCIVVAATTLECVPSGPSEETSDKAARRNLPRPSKPSSRLPAEKRKLRLPGSHRPNPGSAAAKATEAPAGGAPTAGRGDKSGAPVAASVGPAPAVGSGPPGADPLLKDTYRDYFERSALGPDWRATKGVWRIQRGRLCARNARNHPVWLRRRLPVNARVEFDATSDSPDGDIKAEIWGDGKGAATGVSYDNATSYITIFGGWKNRFHVLARIDEHAKNRPEIKIDPSGADLRARPVKPKVTYHFKVERNDGRTVRWLVDDIEIHRLEDPHPLAGAGHDHFAFNDWEVPLCFDNLQITPLSGG